MKHFVIEHPTRGWYLGSEYKWVAGGYKWVPRFAWSILGSDECVHRMYNRTEVSLQMERIPDKVREKCRIKEISK